MLRYVRTSLVTMFAFFALSCGSDDETPTNPGGESDPDVITATVMLNNVVAPLVRDVFIGEYVGMPAPTNSERALPCNALGVCTSGTGQVCVDPGSFSLTFTGCQIRGVTVNGTVTLTTQASSGMGTMTLTVGNTVITGDISYMSDQTCFGQYFTNCEITSPGRPTITMAGSSSWCDPYAMVDGNVIPTFSSFEFVIASLDRLIDATIFSDPVGGLEVVILNAGRTKVLKVCHGTFTRGDLSCFAGPDA